MSLLNRLLGRPDPETRVLTLTDVYGSDMGSYGDTSSPDAILSNLSTVAACVRIRSELTAGVGLHVFRRGPDGARSRADDLPLYDVLHSVANPNQTAFEFREIMVRDLDTRGNAYAKIERDEAGQVIALYRLDPTTVTIEKLANGRLRYKAGGQVFLADEILHIRGPSKDGVIGQSPLTISSGVYGLAIVQAKTAERVAENAVRSSGVLSFENKLSPDARAGVSAAMKDFSSNGKKAGGVLVLDGGPDFKPIELSSADMEFLASRRLTNEDCARCFGIPPTVVGIVDRATYSNVEHEGRALVQNALGPLAGRIEAAMLRCLLTPEERRTLYIEHDLSGLLRGDVFNRFQAYRIAREIGALSPNDIRRMENQPPIPDGDVFHYPGNWIPLGTVANQQGQNIGAQV
jgi:HK97 family phage portal protein